MATTEIHINITAQTCRVCLETQETNLCIHDEIEYNHLSMELWQLLESVCKAKCPWTDPNLPKQLCQNCTRRLISAYEFILEVESTQQMLQDLYLHQTVLEKSDGGNEQVLDIVDQERLIDLGEVLPADYVEQQVGLKEEHLKKEEKLVLKKKKQQVILEEEEPAADVGTGQSEAEDELHFYAEDQVVETETTLQGEEASPNLHRDIQEQTEPSPFPLVRHSQLGSRLTHSESFMFKCAICPRVFAKDESLTRHFAVAHRQAADVAALELASKSSGSGLHCEHCPRAFKRQDTLRRHMMAFHPEVAAENGSDTQDCSTRKRVAKRRECPHCGISFPASSLTIHIRRHTGENPYKCDQCEKAFPRSQDLSLHMRQHTGERPNECKICSKKFISQNKLARHMRLHTGQRPYACNRCSKTFVQSNDLKIHMRRHTGERPYQCGVCGDSFVCGSLLNIHRNHKRHHEAVNQGAESEVYVNNRVNNRGAEDIERMRQMRALEEHQHQPITAPVSQALSYKCGVCGLNFKSGALLTIHRNNMSHYELGKVDYGDPFGERLKSRRLQ
ncbi:hypothetical protein KR009_005677 [Drosophila setifemur]|nr:hypothetical protein KR009_005677 [Drosophila setifemur]